MIDSATDPWGIDIERVEVGGITSRSLTLLAPYSHPPPTGEGREAAPEPAESHGGGGRGYQGGQG